MLLQGALNEAHVSSVLTQDGVFGPLTQQAVVNYQTSRNLPADGIAGPQTLNALASSTPPAGVPVSHRYPLSFGPEQAATWAAANVLTPSTDPYQPDDPCTQFVSQALHAAGMPYVQNWYPATDAISDYMYGYAHQADWYAVDNLRNWLLGNQWVTQREFYPGANPTAISIGDLVYYQWYGKTGKETHIAIVTRISGGNVYVSDQGGTKIRSLNRLWYIDHTGADLTKVYPSMKVFILHWQ